MVSNSGLSFHQCDWIVIEHQTTIDKVLTESNCTSCMFPAPNHPDNWKFEQLHLDTPGGKVSACSVVLLA